MAGRKKQRHGSQCMKPTADAGPSPSGEWTRLGCDPAQWKLPDPDVELEWSYPAFVDTSPLGGEESTMGKTRSPYPAEFRARMVELVRSGRTPEELSREFEPTAQSISNWVGQADRDQGVRHDGLTTDDKEELRRLRRENKILREEKEILRKAAAWFAEETGSTPRGRSSS